jgi:hypothetical protein
MNASCPQCKSLMIGATASVGAMLLAACASNPSIAPRQVNASNPTVTYQYRNDDELIQANQRAIGFCEPYHAVPKAQRFTKDSNSRRVVVFECVPSARAAQLRQVNPNLRYNYRTDQELLDASSKAQMHCQSIGRPQTSSDIVVNSDGSRTVTFHCSQGLTSAN